MIATSGHGGDLWRRRFEDACISATFETLYQYMGTQQNVLWNLRLAVHDRSSDTTTAG